MLRWAPTFPSISRELHVAAHVKVGDLLLHQLLISPLISQGRLCWSQGYSQHETCSDEPCLAMPCRNSSASFATAVALHILSNDAGESRIEQGAVAKNCCLSTTSIFVDSPHPPPPRGARTHHFCTSIIQCDAAYDQAFLSVQCPTPLSHACAAELQMNA